MDFEFGSDALDRLYTDLSFSDGLPPEVCKAYRKRVGAIKAALDERDLRNVRGNRFEKLNGARSHQYSMRLNDQWRLIMEIAAGNPKNKVVLVSIEDYHK